MVVGCNLEGYQVVVVMIVHQQEDPKVHSDVRMEGLLCAGRLVDQPQRQDCSSDPLIKYTDKLTSFSSNTLS